MHACKVCGRNGHSANNKVMSMECGALVAACIRSQIKIDPVFVKLQKQKEILT